MVKPAALSHAAGLIQAELGMSERRACTVVGLARSTWSYASRRPEAKELVEKLKALALQALCNRTTAGVLS